MGFRNAYLMAPFLIKCFVTFVTHDYPGRGGSLLLLECLLNFLFEIQVYVKGLEYFHIFWIDFVFRGELAHQLLRFSARLFTFLGQFLEFVGQLTFLHDLRHLLQRQLSEQGAGLGSLRLPLKYALTFLDDPGECEDPERHFILRGREKLVRPPPAHQNEFEMPFHLRLLLATRA